MHGGPAMTMSIAVIESQKGTHEPIDSRASFTYIDDLLKFISRLSKTYSKLGYYTNSMPSEGKFSPYAGSWFDLNTMHGNFVPFNMDNLSN
jgi:hypothetical protein